jgi:hypothetical protein
MKLLLFCGMAIVFISVFFMLSIFDGLVKKNVECTRNLESLQCKLRDFGFSFVTGLALIGMFCLVDAAVVYLIARSLLPGASYYPDEA